MAGEDDVEDVERDEDAVRMEAVGEYASCWCCFLRTVVVATTCDGIKNREAPE